MYTIVIEDIERIYDSFSNVKENSKLADAMFDYFLQATGKAEGLKTGNRPVSKTFFVDDIPIPEPFTSMLTRFESNGIEYSGKVSFSSNPENYKSILDNLSRDNENDDSLVRFSDSIVFRMGKVPMFLVKKNPFGIQIVLGDSGTMKRNLTNYDQFHADMKNLEKIANQIVNSCIDKKTEMICPIYIIK